VSGIVALIGCPLSAVWLSHGLRGPGTAGREWLEKGLLCSNSVCPYCTYGVRPLARTNVISGSHARVTVLHAAPSVSAARQKSPQCPQRIAPPSQPGSTQLRRST
jgi:hypothetical protein